VGPTRLREKLRRVGPSATRCALGPADSTDFAKSYIGV